MIDSLRKLVRRAFVGFPEHYRLVEGVVVGTADPLDVEKGTDLFRPRYAVDVQILTPTGEPDPDQPVLEGLPLPGLACGDGRGLFGFPDPGTRVLIYYAYGLPSHPRILQLYPQGRAVPALRPGELLLQQQDGAFLRFDAKGNVSLQTDGLLREDSHRREIEADAATETLGALARTVDGDQSETINGRLLQTILGALIQQVAGDARAAIVGSEERTIGGDQETLVAGKFGLIAGTDATLKATLGDVSIEAVLGSAEFKSAVKNSITSALVDLGMTPTDALVLGTAFLALFNAHTHASGGSGPPATPMVPGIHTSVTVQTT